MHITRLATSLIVLVAAPVLARAQHTAPSGPTAPPATARTPPVAPAVPATASDEPTLTVGPAVSEPHAQTAHVTGLPALSADGRTVVAEAIDVQPATEGGLTLLFLDVATGRVRQRVVVQTPTQYADLQDNAPSAPALLSALQARVAAARAAMASLQLRTLREGGEVEHSEGDDDALTVTAGPLRIRSVGATLTGRRTENGAEREVLHATLPAAREARACRGANPPTLRAAYALGTDRVLALAGWHGNDTCWESNPVWRVYRLRARP